MTQQALADALSPPATRASIANVEAGKQRVLAHTLVQLASALGTSVSDLLPVSEEPRPDVIRDELQQKLQLPNKDFRRIAAKLVPARSKDQK